jgi:predicted nuclease with TOPRIM domain
VEAAYLEYIKKLNEKLEERNARITELEKKWKELSDERKLLKAVLRFQTTGLKRQQETATIMCDFCFIQELKFTLYTMHDRECTRL